MLAVWTVILVVCSGVCVASPAGRAAECCTFNAWTGAFSLITGYSNSEGQGLVATTNNQTMDYDNMRTALLIRNYAGGKHTRMVIDSKVNKSYTFDPEGTYCTVTHWNIPLGFRCQPASTFPSVTIGSKGESIRVKSWSHEVENSQMKGHVTIGRTAETCTIASMIATGEGKQPGFPVSKFLALYGFFDIEEGIKDPSVFDLPTVCKSAVFEKEHKPHVLNMLQHLTL